MKGSIEMHLPEGFSYVPGFLAPLEQDVLLAQVRALPFVHDRFYGQPLKRRYSQFGAAYVSIGRKLVPAPSFPGYLASIVEQAMLHCPGAVRFDQCIVTHYPVGAGIGWHTDADCFGDTILAVSLAGHAKLRLRPTKATKHTHELIVAPGALYGLQGPARWEFQHQVVPVKTERYSLTFRHVLSERQP